MVDFDVTFVLFAVYCNCCCEYSNQQEAQATQTVLGQTVDPDVQIVEPAVPWYWCLLHSFDEFYIKITFRFSHFVIFSVTI